MNGWYLFSGICVAAGVVMIVVAQVIKKIIIKITGRRKLI